MTAQTDQQTTVFRTQIERQESPGLTSQITYFRGKYAWLSNFHIVGETLSDGGVTVFGPPYIRYQDIDYPSAEHAFQASKTWSRKERISISKMILATSARKAGRNVRLRPDWEEVKVSVLAEILSIKFQIPRLRELLVATVGRELIEGGDWCGSLLFYGSCRCKEHRRPWREVKDGEWDGTGENITGNLIMAVRDTLLD